MKPGSIKKGPVLIVLAAVVAALALVSWDFKQIPDRLQQKQFNDTLPEKKNDNRERKIRNLDEALDEVNNIDLKATIDKAMKEVAEAMKNFDGEKIRLEIEKAMKEVDMAKIQKEVQESMAKVDWGKMQKEVRESMKEFDAEKVKLEVERAMKEVDMAKIQKEVQESIAKVDWEKMKKEINMEKLNAEMEKVKEEMKDLGPRIEKEMQKARVEIEKAKTELKEYKEFVDGLDKDGLINKKGEYSIKHKDGELTVNGKKVSEQTYTKYRSFLEKHKTFTIKKSNDDFNIDLD